MKLLQANIWGGRLGDQVIKLLQNEAADLVCLQEAISSPGDAHLATSIEEIAKASDYTEQYFSAVFAFHLMNKVAEFGNVILSKQPFAEAATIFTNLAHKEDFDFDNDDYNIRNLQHVSVAVGDKILHILNHHGHHIHQHKDGDAQTLRQMNVIADYIATLSGPVILTGDFNLSPHSESLEILNAQLTNLSITHKLETTRTFLTRKSEVCDYIFVNDAVTVERFAASDFIASDHKALLLEFSV